MDFTDRCRGSELYVSKLICEYPELLNYLQEQDLTFTDTVAIMWEACRMVCDGRDRDSWFAREEVRERLAGCVKNGNIAHLHHWLEVDVGEFDQHLAELRRCRWLRAIRSIHNALGKKVDDGDPHQALEWLEGMAAKLRRSIDEAPYPRGDRGDQADGLWQTQQSNQKADGDDRAAGSWTDSGSTQGKIIAAV